jgi:hypothetical protein
VDASSEDLRLASANCQSGQQYCGGLRKESRRLRLGLIETTPGYGLGDTSRAFNARCWRWCWVELDRRQWRIQRKRVGRNRLNSETRRRGLTGTPSGAAPECVRPGLRRRGFPRTVGRGKCLLESVRGQRRNCRNRSYQLLFQHACNTGRGASCPHLSQADPGSGASGRGRPHAGRPGNGRGRHICWPQRLRSAYWPRGAACRSSARHATEAAATA